jgi:hypothetical protein
MAAGLDWSVWHKDRWRAFANAVMKLRVAYNAGNFLLDKQLLAYQGLRSMELRS